MKKVSIIMPVYNVSLYLEQCLDSLLNQTYSNIEIIAVDDNSTDNSYEILQKYQNKDDRLQIFHKENGGAASARNYALNRYTGEYICFVDSDDYVEPNYIEKLVYYLEKYQSDIAVSSYYDLYTDHIVKHDFHCNILEFTDEQFIERFLDDWTCGIIWNKIFKEEVLKDIRFKEGHKIDDEFFTYQLVMNASKIVLFNEPIIYYRRRKSSVMNNPNSKLLIVSDRLEYLEERYKNVVKKYSNLKNKYTINFIENLIILKSECNEKILFRKYAFFRNKYVGSFIFTKCNIKIKVVYIYLLFFKKTIERENIENINNESLFY